MVRYGFGNCEENRSGRFSGLKSVLRVLPAMLVICFLATDTLAATLRSVTSGNWSNPGIWDGNRVPGSGDDVVVDSGHVVIYDVSSGDDIHLILVRGKLEFSRTNDTRLDVGAIVISTSPTVDINLNCSFQNYPNDWQSGPPPTLEVGSLDNPIPENHTARIRLVYFSDMDPNCAPAIINYGGRMELHGAPLNKTWLKLGAGAPQGSSTITVEDQVNWKVGDRIIITATNWQGGNIHGFGSYRNNGRARTEERVITAVSGTTISLDAPLQHNHNGTGTYRADVGNLSRNVVIESADPNGVRGHTMYHHGTSGSISYAEFAHLGKAGELARYPVHFHVVKSTNRGGSVIGASIWDSHNRFLTIHGTNYLVVRDCVGYQSLGHGFFMEDASEVYNFLDHNLSVQAFETDQLPNQALPYDDNLGAGFWWANGRNAFTNNVAAECDRYGFLFDIRSDIFASVLQPDGTIQNNVQVDRLAFINFDGNEVHNSLLYGYWGNGNALPDDPFHIKNFKVWKTWYAFGANGFNTMVDNLSLQRVAYGYYGPDAKQARVTGLTVQNCGNASIMAYREPEGMLTFDGVTIDTAGSYPFELTGRNPTPQTCDVHIRNYTVSNIDDGHDAAGSEGSNAQPHPDRTMYLHDFFGAGQDAKVIPASQTRNDGLNYQSMPPRFESNVRVAVTSVPFPTSPIQPVDNLPPATVIIYPAHGQIFPSQTHQITVVGTCIDASTITEVTVNGVPATPLGENFAQWQATLTNLSGGEVLIQAGARDEFGNVELTPHRVNVGIGVVPTGVDSGDEGPTLTRDFKLIGNFPNPFNPETRIKFQVADNGGSSLVRLSIYDMLGRRIRTLVNSNLGPGLYERVWDGRDESGNTAASGLYIYEMIAKNNQSSSVFRESRKMLLVR